MCLNSGIASFFTLGRLHEYEEMKISGIRYSISEGIADILRNSMVSLLSIITISISITVLGLFALISVNVQGLVENADRSLIVHVFLSDDLLNDDTDQELRLAFEEDSRVNAYEFVSPELAQQRFETLFPDEAELGKNLSSFALPASYDVTINPDEISSDDELQNLAAFYTQFDLVDEVIYDSMWQKSLQAIASWVTSLGYFLGALLMFAAIVTTANIIKLNYLGRKEEIEIMRLVGADNIFIKGPFIVSGILQGFFASLLSIGLLYGVFLIGVSFLDSAEIVLINNVNYSFLPWHHMGVLIAGGLFSGLFASLLTLSSVNKI
jgi:cell division transport system permease protein